MSCVTPTISRQGPEASQRIRLPSAACGSPQSSRARFSETSVTGAALIDVGPREVAARDEARAERLEVAWRDAARAHRQRLAEVRPVLDGDRGPRHGTSRRAAATRHAAADSPPRSHPAARQFVRGFRGREASSALHPVSAPAESRYARAGRFPGRLKPGSTAVSARNVRIIEPGADEQHERERDLHDDQRAARAIALAARARAARAPRRAASRCRTRASRRGSRRTAGSTRATRRRRTRARRGPTPMSSTRGRFGGAKAASSWSPA